MATQSHQLVIEINANQAQHSIELLRRELQRMADSGELSADVLRNLGNNANRQAGSIDALQGSIKQLVASFVSLQAIQGALVKADSYTEMSNRLRLVTNSQKELADAMEATFKIAQRTRGSWDGTIQVYQKFAQNAAQLRLSLKEVAQITETMNKAVALSGASTQAAEAAMFQLGQALASGALRGDEFNSIAEQTPVVMDVLAKGLGVTRAELRELAGEGKLTANKVAQAMLKMSDSVDKDFAKTKATFSQAMQGFQDSLTKYVGETDKSLGATEKLAAGVQVLSKNVDAIAFGGAALGAAVFVKWLATAQIAAGATTVRLLSMNGALAATKVLLTGPVGLVLAATAAAAAYANLRFDANATTQALQEQKPVVADVVAEFEKMNKQGRMTMFTEMERKLDDAKDALKRAEKQLTEGWDKITAQGVVKQFLDGKIALKELNTELMQHSNVSESTRNSMLESAKAYLEAKDSVEKAKAALKAMEDVNNGLKPVVDSTNKSIGDTKSATDKAAAGVNNLSKGLDDYVEKAKKAREEVDKLNKKWAEENELTAAILKFRKEGFSQDVAEAMAEVHVKGKPLNEMQRATEVARAQGLANSIEKNKKELEALDEREKAKEKANKKGTSTRFNSQRQEEWRRFGGRVMGVSRDYHFERIAASHGLPRNLMTALMMTESQGNRNARSPAGALGVLQVVPRWHPSVNALDPKSSIEGMSRYMAGLLKRYNGNLNLALNAYNWGEGNVDKAKARAKKTGKYVIPKETKGHMARTLWHMQYLNSGGTFQGGGNDWQAGYENPVSGWNEEQKYLEEQARKQEEINKSVSDYLSQNKEAVLLLGKETEYAKLQARIEAGAHAEKSAAQRQEMLQAAKQFDLAKERWQLEELAYSQKRDFADQVFELELLGKTREEVVLLTEARKYDLMIQDAQRKGASVDYVAGLEKYKGIAVQNAADIEVKRKENEYIQLADNLAGTTAIREYYQSVEMIARAWEEGLISFDKYQLAVAQLTVPEQLKNPDDWQGGILDGMRNVASQAKSMRDIFADGTASVIGSLENGFVQLAATGKLSMREMTASVLQDLAKIAMRMAMLKLVDVAVSSISGWQSDYSNGMSWGSTFNANKSADPIAALNSSQGWTGSLYSMLPPYADGGFTGYGGKFDPAGIVHRGEYVLSQQHVRLLGGVRAIENLLYQAKGYSSNGWYSSGGLVGFTPPVLRQTEMQRQAAPNITVNVTVEGGNKDTEQQVAAGVEAGLLKAMRQVADARIAESWRMGNISYRMAHGG